MSDFPPIASPTDPPFPVPPPLTGTEFPALVRARNWVFYAGLLNAFSLAIFEIVSLQASPPTSPLNATNLFVLFLGLPALHTAIAVWNLARALHYKMPWLMALVLLLSLGFCTLLALPVLLLLHIQASSKLQKNGYKVGLLNATLVNGDAIQ